MLKRILDLEPALNLLVADNRVLSTLYPDEDDWVTIKVNKYLIKL